MEFSYLPPELSGKENARHEIKITPWDRKGGYRTLAHIEDHVVLSPEQQGRKGGGRDTQRSLSGRACEKRKSQRSIPERRRREGVHKRILISSEHEKREKRPESQFLFSSCHKGKKKWLTDSF